MTTLTDLEINKRLALAIGWKPKQIQERCGMLFVMFNNAWSRFDFRHTSTIWPIAERYNCFPIKQRDGNWRAFIGHDGCMKVAVTAAKAVALAVIGSAK